MRAAKEQRAEGRTSEPVSSLKRLIKQALSVEGETRIRKSEWRDQTNEKKIPSALWQAAKDIDMRAHMYIHVCVGVAP